MVQSVEPVEAADTTRAKPRSVPRPRLKPKQKQKPEPKQKPKTPPRPKPPAAGPPPHWRSPGGRAARAMVRSLALLLLVLAVLELLRITLVPTPGSVAFTRPSMRPFATIRLYMREGTVEEQILQIGGNLALGFLLGFLLPQITPYLRGLIRIEAVTAAFVAGIELIQHSFIPGTTVTVDVLILTAAGAALGYVPLGRLFGMRLHPDHLHWWQHILARHAARRRGLRGEKAS